MKRNVFLSLSLLLLTSVCAFTAHGQDTNAIKNMANQVFLYVNHHRTEMGLPELKINAVIEQEALQHSSNMATKKIPLGHDGFDERMGRIMKQIKPSHAAAENVADGAKTAREVVDIWLHSPGHRKNIEGDYTLTGIGIVADKDGKLFFTQIFINKS